MDKLIANPSRAALVSGVMAAPMTVVILVAAFGLQPLAGPLAEFLVGPDGRQTMAGIVLLLACLALLAGGFAISLLSVVNTVRAHQPVSANAANLFLATAMGAFLIVITVAVVTGRLSLLLQP